MTATFSYASIAPLPWRPGAPARMRMGHALVHSDSIYDDKEDIAKTVSEGRHRDVAGGLWEEIGALQFDFLKRQGLSTGDHLLDIGCGSLRGGVHFAAYLQPGHYWGVDSNEPLLEAGYNIELNRLNLTGRVPRNNLLCDEEFSFERFGRTFDVAIAQSLFTHLPANRIRLCLNNLAKVVRTGGRLFATYFEAPEEHAFDQPLLHSKGGVTTYGFKDPFHYRYSEMSKLVDDLPWVITWHGEWDHPRDQRMMILERRA